MENQTESIETLHDLFTQVINNKGNFPIDFDEAWQWIGYASKQMGQEMLEKNFDFEVDFSILGLKNTGQKGRPATHVMLTVDCFKSFCMLAQTEKGKDVRRYYIRLEKEMKLLGGSNKKQLDPGGKRSQLIKQIKKDKNAIPLLEETLRDNPDYVTLLNTQKRVTTNESELKKMDKTIVLELNFMAEQSDKDGENEGGQTVENE